MVFPLKPPFSYGKPPLNHHDFTGHPPPLHWPRAVRSHQRCPARNRGARRWTRPGPWRSSSHPRCCPGGSSSSQCINIHNIYIYIHMCIYIYIYIYICVFIYIYVCVCVHACMYVYVLLTYLFHPFINLFIICSCFMHVFIYYLVMYLC